MEKIELISYYDDHFYRVEEHGEVYYLPSVTTKLGVIEKPQLARWRGDIGNREADLKMTEAQDRGKRIHWAWETVLNGGIAIYNPYQHPNYSQEQLEALNAKFGALNVVVLRVQDEMVQIHKLKSQFDLLKPEVLGVEKKVYDLEHRDAGTIDSILKIQKGDYMIAGAKPLSLKEGIYIQDLKTGNYLDDNVWLQLAAYTYMFEKMFEAKVQGALVTHTSAKTKGGIAGLTTLFRDRETLLDKDYNDYRHAAALWERNHADDQPKTFTFPTAITLNENIKLNNKGENDNG